MMSKCAITVISPLRKQKYVIRGSRNQSAESSIKCYTGIFIDCAVLSHKTLSNVKNVLLKFVQINAWDFSILHKQICFCRLAQGKQTSLLDRLIVFL